ncbi:MAG: hypothetical protein KDE33_23235 [Bacteroidetes bacterium]|nr:hypothetical protein [Bacteroidota bacterium]MCB9226877.1 hypothetical protein [Chitinophagales bacterium]
MKKTDRLHELVISLTTTEKRLFKRYVSNANSKDNNYVELFDVLSKMDEYDEKILSKKLKNKNTVKNLAQSKKYLKDLILKCMRDIDENRAEDIVNELLREYNFLKKKNLIEEQWKKIQKAKEVAEEYELYNAQLEVLEAERGYFQLHDFNVFKNGFDNYNKEKEALIDKYALYNRLEVLNNKVFLYVRGLNFSVKNEHTEELKNEIEKYDETQVLQLNSFKINILWYKINANYNNLISNHERELIYREKMVNSYKKNKKRIAIDTYSYLIFYFNFLYALFRNSKFEELKRQIAEIEKIKIDNDNTRREYLLNYLIYSVLYKLNTGNIDNIDNELKKMKVLEKEFIHSINKASLMTLYFNFSTIYFIKSDFYEVLEWLDKIQSVKANVRIDLKAFVKIMEIICHYELENYTLAESLIRAYTRRPDTNEDHKVFLRLINKLINTGQLEKKKVFEEIQAELGSLTDFKIGKDLIDLWLSAKLQNEDIQKVYKKNFTLV